MEIKYSKDNTHIEKSHEVINKQIMEQYILWIIEERKARKYPITRTKKSYMREWLGHNLLYKLGLFKRHTESVDLNENNSVIEELIWWIIGR